ncbi:Dual specificity protein phosphatase 18 [Toxocara canis]|uniref:Dual specificity protein phosphatase 18 n=1 Tax=Toxocara canis TaxID=6265 RepID=A0A0B2VVR0_TOXCA|nr:Dual specificity protein phosphatase 18 [Toxocara canis]
MTPLTFRVNKAHSKITEVSPGLYVSGVTALKKELIKACRITLILNTTNEVPNLAQLGNVRCRKLWLEDSADQYTQDNFDVFCDEVPNLAQLGNVRCRKLWLEDSADQYTQDNFDVFCDEIDWTLASGGRVLIHSVRGVSRSAALCLAYLTKYRCRSLRDAYYFLASKRSLVCPNIGFWKQLIAFEQEVKGTNGSVRLIRDEEDLTKLIPDVYKFASIVLKESNRKRENSIRRDSLTKRFKPVLEPIPEDTENIIA